jgi:hypothetical protein
VVSLFLPVASPIGPSVLENRYLYARSTSSDRQAALTRISRAGNRAIYRVMTVSPCLRKNILWRELIAAVARAPAMGLARRQFGSRCCTLPTLHVTPSKNLMPFA